MTLLQTIKVATLAILPLFLLLDVLLPGSTAARGWRGRGLAVTACSFALSLGLGEGYHALFGGASLLPGAGLGTWGGALCGLVVYDFFHYWYHRAAHRFGLLWRLGHQMHHSVESLDAWGAYYLHPIDAFLFLTLSNVVLYPLLGLTPEAGALATAAATLCAVLQHARVPTPRWVGWLVQRPESHGVHHARGVHAFNYANLPLWDAIFGTLRNPRGKSLQPMLGFHDGASARILDMLMFRDVTREARRSRARAGSAR
jgi:sterol desaturase/sphingolipid hydroxylase (fatty acid hydroxylase superfamily)